MTHLLEKDGLIILFLLVAVEGIGIPLPGEAALITAGVLASQGHFSIEAVIAVAAVGAFTGTNIGYWVGRLGGRRLLDRIPFVRTEYHRVLPRVEAFFDRHGPKTVFAARFISILRFAAALVAGISRMTWWKFFAFDSAGSVVWATVYGLVAYEFGNAAADAIAHYGLIVVVALVVVGVAYLAVRRITKRREPRSGV